MNALDLLRALIACACFLFRALVGAADLRAELRDIDRSP